MSIGFRERRWAERAACPEDVNGRRVIALTDFANEWVELRLRTKRDDQNLGGGYNRR